MLSRVANSLYWLSRYIERAENLARLSDVSGHDALESLGSEDIWHPVLYATGTQETYAEALEKGDGEGLDVGRFISFSAANTDSIRECIAHARENARMVRDQVSEDMWLEINRFHLFIQSPAAERLWENRPEEFYRTVIKFCLLFEGLIESTILHDEGWEFAKAGIHLERADKTSRFLDMLTYKGTPTRSQLASVLRSCSALSAFRREFRGDITLSNVVEFLLFSEAFPRSIRFCVRHFDDSLHSISGYPSGSYASEVERLNGALLARLSFSNPESVWATGLHEYLDNLQAELNVIGQHLFETYVLLPSEIEKLARPRDSYNLLQFHQQQQQQ